MHPEAMSWVAEHATSDPVAVLDLGGRNINGTVRGLFPSADPYVSLDLVADSGVDVVADASTWAPDREYDVVVCCEVFEHTPVWPQIIATAYEALKPGGRFILTTAAPGRPEHSAVDGRQLRPGEHYANIDPEDLRTVLEGCGFADITVDRQHSPDDVRASAARP